MEKMTLVAYMVLAVSALSPYRVFSCACCSNTNTFIGWETSFSDLAGIKLDGNMGVYIYGERGEPEIDVAKAAVSGEISNENINLSLKRADKLLGVLILTPKGKPIYRRIGFDLLLSPEFLNKLDYGLNLPVYHEISVYMDVKADQPLQNALGISFDPNATIRLQGNSNACWDPSEDGSWWTLQYSVRKETVTEEAFAKGKLAR